MPVILVVDDSPAIQELLVQALTDQGYQAVGAENGDAALRILREVQADIIILDYSMPVMDGRSFLENYRQMPGPHAPVILITAALSAADRALQLGVELFLEKPFDLDELIAMTSRFVGDGDGSED